MENRIDTIKQNGFDPRKELFDDGQLLRKVEELALKSSSLNTKNFDLNDKVIDFKHPHELKKLLQLDVNNEGLESWPEIEELLQRCSDYSVKSGHPLFYNQLYGGIDEVALAGAWMVESMNNNQHTFEVGPVFILAEHYMINFLGNLFGYQESDGIFSPGGSISNMYGMLLARHKKYPDLKKTGLFGRKPLIAFTSDQSHYSIKKNGHIMGLGLDHVIQVKTDPEGRMTGSALQEAMQKARADGGEPFFVNACAAGTVLGAYDFLEEIADVCDKEGIWMHVDACWGGGAVLSKKHKHLLKGIERSDSFAFNGHKMLCVPLQCAPFVTKHKGLLSECNKLGATYLFQQDKLYDVSYDTGDKGIQCGRKADGFKLWFMLKVWGLDHHERLIDNAFEIARYLEEQIHKRPGFKPVIPKHQCTNICFWYIPPSMRNEEETEEWWMKIHKITAAIKGKAVLSGSFMVGYQPIENKNLVNFFRMVVAAFPQSTKQEMDHLLDEIESLGNEL